MFRTTGSLLFVVLLTIGVFRPGLNGPFLFDDFANLPALADFDGVRYFESLRLFLLNGIAGPTGRPLSLLSFLINDNAWPSDPRGFKHTNLMIHLLNGCLLFWVTFRVNRVCDVDDIKSGWIALLVAGFSLLHPLNISTVLYVVQRMAMLSAMFVLVGLLLYIVGREILSRSQRQGYFWMSVAILLFTPLAILCKENGALLPLLALVVERTWLSKAPAKSPNAMWIGGFLWLPTLVLVAYIIQHAIFTNAYDGRSFNLADRLLTEPTVLLDYLLHWWVPFLPTRGLFNEDYPINHSLFEPVTLASTLGIALLIIWAWLARHRYPAITLAISFFFAGHLLESTCLPLEIYFEHRNYLPAMLLFFPVAQTVVNQSANLRLLPALIGTLLLGMGVITHRLAQTWGNETKLALTWAVENPTSSRAQGWAADILAQHGRPDLATTLLRIAVRQIPNDIHLHIDYLVRACVSGDLKQAELEDALGKFRTIPYEFRSFPYLEIIYQSLPSAECHLLNFAALHTILDSLEQNPQANGAGPQRQLHQLRGILYSRQGIGDHALSEFRLALQALPAISTGLGEVAILASSGLYQEALQLLSEVKKYPQAHRNASDREPGSLDYPDEITRLERIIEDDLAHLRKPTSRNMPFSNAPEH